MASILTTARLVCKDTQAREKAIDAFRKIIEYTGPNEPEVLQYVCAIPHDDNSGNEIYMIEEYANQAASDAHLATKPVQDLIQLFTTGDVLAQPPEVHNCPVVFKKTLSAALSVSSEPAVVLLNIPSQTNQSATPMTKMEKIVERATRDIKGVNKLVTAEDKESTSMRIECVLQDWDTFTDFQSLASQDEAHTTELVPIKFICGFLDREGKSKL